MYILLPKTFSYIYRNLFQKEFYILLINLGLHLQEIHVQNIYILLKLLFNIYVKHVVLNLYCTEIFHNNLKIIVNIFYQKELSVQRINFGSIQIVAIFNAFQENILLITFLQKIFKNFFNLLFLLFFFFNILNDFKRILFIRKLFLQIFIYRLKGKNFYFLWLVFSGGYFVFLIVFFLIL